MSQELALVGKYNRSQLTVISTRSPQPAGWRGEISTGGSLKFILSEVEGPGLGMAIDTISLGR